jgi:hypothetical protein
LGGAELIVGHDQPPRIDMPRIYTLALSTSHISRDESCSPYETIASFNIASGSERRDARINKSESSSRENCISVSNRFDEPSE